VIIPVIRLAGVTSNAGFQQLIPINTYTPNYVQFRTTMHPDNQKERDHSEDLITDSRIII
jgi:hypothetical protein